MVLEVVLDDLSVSESHHGNGGGSDGRSGHLDGESLLVVLFFLTFFFLFNNLLLGLGVWHGYDEVVSDTSGLPEPGLVGEECSVGGCLSDIIASLSSSLLVDLAGVGSCG